MTDEQIVKALENCYLRNDTCSNCSYKPGNKNEGMCMDRLGKDALDLIRRQQAELDRLERHTKLHDEIQVEAIKEFADKLKEKAVDVGICDAQGNSFGGATVVFVGDIDNLVKEMVGADNG